MGKESLTAGPPSRVAVLVLAAALLAAGPLAATARAQADRPRLRLGDGPGGYDEGRAKKHVLLARPAGDNTVETPAILWLRPNTETAVFPYVVNPSQDDAVVRVRLLARDGSVVAETAATPVPGKEETKPAEPRRVSLAAPAPAKEAAAPEAPPKEPPSAWVKGDGLPPQFRLELMQITKDKTTGKEVERPVDRIAVAILIPQWYVAAKAVYIGAENRLTVTVERDKDTFAGGACPLQLAVFLPDPKTGQPARLAAPKDAVMDRPLSIDQDSVELTVADPRLALLTGKEAKALSPVSLTVDGYEHAFRFESGFEAKTAQTLLTPLTKTSLRLEAPAAWPPGTDLPVRLGVDDVLGTRPVNELDFEVTLQVDLGRVKKDGTFDPIEGDRLPGHRLQRVSVNPQAPKGAMAFKTEVRDWEVALPTKGIVGARRVRAAVQPKGGRAEGVPAVFRDVILDGTPPEITQLGVRKRGPEDPLPRLERGAGELALFAVGSDPESGISKVLFFLGRPEKDPKLPGSHKMPDGVTPVEGQPAKGEPDTWLAQLPVSADKPGAVDVGVQFVNKAGLVTFGTVRVELVEPKAGGKAGSIEGKVLEGDRPQPGVEVTLRDAQNAVKATTLTDKKTGVYKFLDVPPGAYRVSAAKSTSGTRGETPVQVEAGDTKKDIDVRLLR
jgi:hypothetical protein